MMRNYRELTDDEVQELERLYPVTPNRELARRYDISVDAIVDRLARPRGWQKDQKAVRLGNRGGRSLTEREVAWIVRHYKHTSNPDIMARFGIGESTLHRIARKHGLTKSRQQMQKTQRAASEAGRQTCVDYGIYEESSRRQTQLLADMRARGERIPGSFMPGQSNKDRLSPKRFKESMAKIHAKRNETIRRDRIRIHWGMEPKSKLVKNWDAKRDWHKPHYRYKFRQYGYDVEPGSSDVYYHPDTVRHPIMEANAERWGFRLHPAGEEL